MPPSADDASDRLSPVPRSDEELLVSMPSEGVYVFHTEEEQEFIRIDIVLDPADFR